MNIEQAYALIVEKLTGWLQAIIAMLPNLLLAFVIVLLGVVAARLARRVVRRLLGSMSENSSINELMATIVHLAVLAVGLFIALGVLKLDKTVTSLLAGAGIVGLALGFAFQDIAANFISGIMMAVRKPIAIGDVIESNGHFGTVTAINLRTTEVRTPQGPLILVPNKDVFQQALQNYSELGRRRVDLSVGVSYGDNLERVEQVTLAAIRSLSCVQSADDVVLYFTGYGDSSINLDVCYWITFSRQAEYREALSAGVKAVKAAFDANQITIPFPIRTLDFGIKGGQPLSQVLETRSLTAGDDAPSGRSAHPPTT